MTGSKLARAHVGQNNRIGPNETQEGVGHDEISRHSPQLPPQTRGRAASCQKDCNRGDIKMQVHDLVAKFATAVENDDPMARVRTVLDNLCTDLEEQKRGQEQ